MTNETIIFERTYPEKEFALKLTTKPKIISRTHNTAEVVMMIAKSSITLHLQKRGNWFGCAGYHLVEIKKPGAKPRIEKRPTIIESNLRLN